MSTRDEEYEMSERSEQAVAMLWPESLTVGHPQFQQRMYELQIKLIEGHLHTMYAADKRRAYTTLRYLKQKVKEVADARPQAVAA